MSQFDFGTIIATAKTGSALATDLNAWRNALHSQHKGSVAPAYAVAGMQWVDDALDPLWLLKTYDGDAWTTIVAIDTTTNSNWPVGVGEKQRYPAAGGTAAALTLTPAIALTAYAAQEVVTFRAALDGTGAATLNVSGVGAKAIRKIELGADIALSVGDIFAASRYVVIYDNAANGGLGAWILVNPTISGIKAGTIVEFAGPAAPSGYLMCFGQALLRSVYAALDIAIYCGDSLNATANYGYRATTDVSPSTNRSTAGTYIVLPDCRGRVSAGKDNMGGVSADRLTNQTGGLDGDILGATGGAEAHALTVAQLPAVTPAGAVAITDPGHKHLLLADATTGSFIAPTAATQIYKSGGGGDAQYALSGVATPATLGLTAGAPTGVTAAFTGASFGGGTSHNNVQPTIVFNKIIKT